jgi:hypothetical protein
MGCVNVDAPHQTLLRCEDPVKLGRAEVVLQALESFGPGVDAAKASELADIAAQREEANVRESMYSRELDEFGRDANTAARETARQQQQRRGEAIAAIGALVTDARSPAPLLDEDALIAAGMCGQDAQTEAVYYTRKVRSLTVRKRKMIGQKITKEKKK